MSSNLAADGVSITADNVRYAEAEEERVQDGIDEAYGARDHGAVADFCKRCELSCQSLS